MTQFGQTPPPAPFSVRPSAIRSAALTYEPYYGLREKAFSLSPDPRFFYKSRAHAPIFDELLAGIRRREGLIVLTGDIGTGKTTLCRSVLEHLDRKTFTTFVPDPFVSREDLLKIMLIEFGVMSVDDLKSGRLNGASHPDLSYPLYEFLKSLVPLQAFAVLVIDEGQNLSVPLLEELRILSDLEAPEKLLQVVLVGQLEFRSKLKLPEMRQLYQRVSVRCELDALNRDGVEGYILHRVAVAGGGSDRIEFPPSAIDIIFRASEGVPRLINLICDRALHHGYLGRTPLIDGVIVRSALRDLGLADPGAPEPPAVVFPSEVDTQKTSSLAVRQLSQLNSPDHQHHGFEDEKPNGDDGTHDIKFHENDLRDADRATLGEQPSSSSRRSEAAAAAAAIAVANQAGQTLLVEACQARTGELVRTRRWWRRRTGGLVAAMVVIALTGAAFVGLSWQEQVDHMTSAPPPLPNPPAVRAAPLAQPQPASDVLPPANVPQGTSKDAAVPEAAAAGLFSIDVAMFSSALRADRLVAELTAAGYRAYRSKLDLGDRGSFHEVLAGTYATRSAADIDAARIRAMPGYQDAKVVAGP